MKRNLLKGMILIGAVALSSCSVNKTASTNNDDVYFSRATAGEQPEYITRENNYRQEEGDDEYTDEDDYYYYDDYASRINRFSYFSPFGYYDYAYSPYAYGNGFGLGLGYGYNPWYSGFGYGGWGYGGFGWNAGLGFGYGGYPWGYGFGYSPWGLGYSPYSYWGLGYGGSPYWGLYSAYRNNPRPYRGNGSPGSSFGNRNGSQFGNANNGIGYFPGRQSRNGVAGYRPATNGGYNNGNSVRQQRQPRTYQQPNIERSAPSSFGGGGSRGGGSSSGGGGGRPSRP